MDEFQKNPTKFLHMRKAVEYTGRLQRAQSYEDKIKVTLKLFEENNMLDKFYNIMTIKKKNQKKSKDGLDISKKITDMPANKIVLINWGFMFMNYSESLRYAPADSPIKAIIYADRSAGLFEVGLYHDCLKDIERALDHNYPDNKKAELYARKAQCLVILDGSASEIKKTLEDTKTWLSKMNLNDKSRKMVEDVVNKPIIKDSFVEERIFLDGERDLPMISDENPKIVGASSAIEFKYTKQDDRHLVAARDIEPGEIIALQKCFATMVSSKRRFDYCFHCTRQTWSGIPCDSCFAAVFCSEECKKEAMNDFHRIECPIIDTLAAFETQDTQTMNIKLLLIGLKEVDGDFEAFKKHIEKIDANQDPKTKGFTGDIYDSQKYASFHALPVLYEQRPFEETVVAIVGATFVIHLLATKTNLFGKKFTGGVDQLSKNKLIIYIGGLLIKQYLQIGINCSLLCEKTRNEEAVGTLAYPLSKQFKHSCVSNISMARCRNYTFTYTTDSIKKGEPLLYDTEYNFMNISKNVRQQMLKNGYFIDCKCKACTENWPVISDLPSVLKSKKVPKQALKKIQDEYDKLVAKSFGMRMTIDGKTLQEDLADVIHFIKLINEHCSFPTIEKYQVVQSLIRIFGARGCQKQRFDDIYP